MFAITAVCFWSGAGTLLANASKSRKPVISSLIAEPTSVPPYGTATVTASVSGADTCTLSASRATAGLPATFPCEAGSVELTGTMPSGEGHRPITYKLTLAASGAGGTVKAMVKVKVTPGLISSYVPVEVTEISTATQLSAGLDHTCALFSNGHVECWGDNYDGQLGNGTTTSSYVPVEVTGISTATQLGAGE